MFSNLEELKTEILEGKTNEEIIKERLEYLNSEKYKARQLSTINRPNTSQVSLYNGYINPDERIAFNGGRVVDCLYSMDEEEIYGELIDLIRNNMDKNGFNSKLLVQKIRNYFKTDESSKYYDLCEYLKRSCPKDPYFARETLPYIINEYVNSNYKGSIKDFGRGYMYHLYSNFGVNAKDRASIERSYYESVDWKKLDDEVDVILPISSIKGAGVAACTEYSMLTQNCLAFLGYDTYLLGGQLSVNGKQEEHNFNVIKRPSSGKYAIVDTAQIVACKNIENVENLREIKNVVVSRSTKDGTELTYTADISKDNRKLSLLQQREDELSSLEIEAKKISKAEALKNAKEGQNIGE